MENLSSQNDNLLIDGLQALMLSREPDIRSPYRLYGQPGMWNVLQQDGLTLAIRPARTMERQGFGHVEVDGICWGWHDNGRWRAHEQHMSGSFPHFVDAVLRPALGCGARPDAEFLRIANPDEAADQLEP